MQIQMMRNAQVPSIVLTAGYSTCPLPRRTPAGISYRLQSGSKEQNAQDAHSGALNHGGFLRKKGREKVAEQEIVTIGTVLHTAEKPRHSHRMRLHRSRCPAA